MFGILTAFVLTAGICKELNAINAAAMDAPAIVGAENTSVVKYSYDYSDLTESEREINQKILKIKQSDITDEEKIVEIGTLLAESGNITYEMGANLFNWDNELLDTDFKHPGLYYKSGMKMDCSAFIQYLYWIATVKDDGKNRTSNCLIGRGTYFQTLDGTKVDEPEVGDLCFRFNGGSGVIRTGEMLLKNETKTSEYNHVAVYFGDDKYLDCSDACNGVRIVDANENAYYKDYFHYFRHVLPDEGESYVTDKEIKYQEKLLYEK